MAGVHQMLMGGGGRGGPGTFTIIAEASGDNVGYIDGSFGAGQGTLDGKSCTQFFTVPLPNIFLSIALSSSPTSTKTINCYDSAGALHFSGVITTDKWTDGSYFNNFSGIKALVAGQTYYAELV